MSSLPQLVRDLGPARVSMLAGVGIALLAVFIVLSFRFSSVNYAPLYTNLETRDSSHIMQALESKGIPYRIENNGSQISVPADKVLQLRMMLAEQGLPSSGSIAGYELFDKSDALGTSNFVQNINMIRALEGELGRTIAAFDAVENARVHLVIPKRELFSREKKDPTASVVLQLMRADGLSAGEIKAISHLVATAVPGLKVANITIVDTKGRPFKLGAEDENDPASLASNAEEYRITIEKRLRNKIEELLQRSVGIGRVQAKVSADIDFDRVVTNSETYDPDGQVVRSVQTVEEKESNIENSNQNNVTVDNNLPTANAQNAGGPTNSNNSQKTDETINYEISKKVENHIKESGTIKRLSIAVLIDGNYRKNSETGEMEYVPRTDEELQKLQALVVSAVGFDKKRGDSIEVVNMQFSREGEEIADTPFNWIKGELHNILQTFVVAIVVILVIMLVIKPMVSRAFELTKVEEEEAEFEAALQKSETAVHAEMEEENSGLVLDLEKIENRVKIGSIKNINDIVDKYPEEALSVLRTWLNKDRI